MAIEIIVSTTTSITTIGRTISSSRVSKTLENTSVKGRYDEVLNQLSKDEGFFGLGGLVGGILWRSLPAWKEWMCWKQWFLMWRCMLNIWFNVYLRPRNIHTYLWWGKNLLRSNGKLQNSWYVKKTSMWILEKNVLKMFSIFVCTNR